MPLLDLFWTMFWFFLWLAWLWLVILVIVDVVRSEDLPSWTKVLWILGIILVPWLGVIIYVIARGASMNERRLEGLGARHRATRRYVHGVARGAIDSVADELARLADLRTSGELSEAEFDAEKARLLAAT